MTVLRIADGLTLPIDFVTSTQAILARKRVGKSYCAQVEAEELLEARQQIIVIDPTGAWFGLRSSADGSSAGYPITIIGGEHGDAPLDVRAGETIAEAVVADRFSVVLDLSLFDDADWPTFIADFLRTLYRLNREAVHLFIDEADITAPQVPEGKEQQRALRAANNIVRRGGIKGIGVTLISQRAQLVNKNVLAMVDQIVAMQMNHPLDLDAISRWIFDHVDETKAKEMLASLPSLGRGEAWVWAPASSIFKRVKIRAKRTFDSGKTPEAGKSSAAPKVLAPVDIARLGRTIAATIARVSESDPVALRKRIAELEAKLRDAAPDNTGLLARICEARAAVDGLGVQLDAAIVAIGKGDTKIEVHDSPQTGRQARTRAPSPAERATSAGSERRSRGVTAGETALLGKSLPAGEHKILRALLEYPRGLRRDQLTVMTGYKRSTRDSYIARLRERGFVETNLVLVTATPAAITAIPDAEPLPVGPKLRVLWLARLPAGEASVLEKLIESYPRPVRREALDADTGFTRSTRDSYLSRLAARELVEIVGRGEVRASATLFEVP